MPFSCRHLVSTTAAAWLLLAGLTCGQTAPPADGILDETRALTPEAHRQLAGDLRLFREDLKCEAWIIATSFVPTGVSLRRHALMTRQAWDGGQPAVLMAYDRASNSSGISFSPAMWQRYPAAELVDIMQESARMFSDGTLTLDERIMAAAGIWMERLRALERTRLKQTLLLQQDEKRLAAAAAAMLGMLAFAAAVLGLISRRRDSRAERRFYFPEVQVAMRLGAPYGGGVTAEVKTAP